jgi:cellulose synthase operon protein C
VPTDAPTPRRKPPPPPGYARRNAEANKESAPSVDAAEVPPARSEVVASAAVASAPILSRPAAPPLVAPARFGARPAASVPAAPKLDNTTTPATTSAAVAKPVAASTSASTKPAAASTPASAAKPVAASTPSIASPVETARAVASTPAAVTPPVARTGTRETPAAASPTRVAKSVPPPPPRTPSQPRVAIPSPGGTIAPRTGEPTPTLATSAASLPGLTDGLRDGYVEDARLAVAAYEEQIERVDDVARRGRLSYEIARLCESALGELERAGTHYDRALAASPEHLPSIVGARRVAMATGQHERAIDLFEREAKLTPDRPSKAALLLAKGRVLEDRLGRIDAAREAYASAIALSDPDLSLYHALEQIEVRSPEWAKLDRLYADAANALVGDPVLRAVYVCRRARLRELHGDDADAAAQLFAQAFELDPDAPGAVSALERLYARRGRWRELVALLEREAGLVGDQVSRALVLHRMAIVLLDRLGDRAAARAALELAASTRPAHPVVLEALARIYEDSGEPALLAGTLTELAEAAQDPADRLGHLHRIGVLCLDALDDREGAITAFEAVLAIDPAHVPTLRALAPLYSASSRFDALIAMHQAEAAAIREPRRRAIAHARAAEILERIGRLEDAAHEHEHALALAADLLPSFEALVRLYAAGERHHQLVELYERHLERADPERRIEYLFAIGDLYRGPLADPEQAEHAYRRILKLQPKHLGAIHALQRVAAASGRWRALVDALELEVQTVRDNSQTADLLHRIGELLDERLGRRDEALTRLRSVLAIDPHHVATLATLGRMFHAEGRWVDLAEVFERELAASPDHPQTVMILHKLGELYARQLGDVERAITVLRRALDLDPQHGPSMQALARILRTRGQWRELAALAELDRDNYRDPGTRALACFQLGQLYEDHLDDREQAERCYAQALELRPGYRPAADALSRMRAELGHWTQLVDELQRDAAALADPRLAIAALYRAGEAARDHVRDAARARACFERVLEREPDHAGALMALEALLRGQNDHAALAEILARQAKSFTDPGARAMALRERVRVLELSGLGDVEDRVEAWSGVLAARPGDRGALAGLEREALASGDPRVIASVDARLAAAVIDPPLRAAFLTRRAEALEAAGGPQALDVYRESLALDPENLAALRGMARLAEVLGDAEALVEVAEREASIAKIPREVADAWVRAGSVRVDRLGDREAAMQAFDHALQQWPDHVEAAARISSLMRAQGLFAKLVERLLRAVGDAREPARQAALGLEVARLYAQELDNLGAAVAALERLLRTQPNDAPALLELAGLHLSDRRVDEAIALLRRATNVATGDALAEAHLLLARALEDKGDPPEAFRHYELALQGRPDDRRILERVVALQLETGLFGAAVDSAARLREHARDANAAVAADIALAQALTGVRRIAEAIDALTDAIVIEGPGGNASSELHALATQPEHWQRYVAALRAQLTAEEQPRAMLYLELARTQHERLGDPDGARATLIEGLRECGDDAGLRFELAHYLRQAHRYVEAVEQQQLVLMDDVVRIETWRSLAQTFDELGQARARALANAALGVFEVASPTEREDIRTWQPRTEVIRPGALAGDVTADLHVARDQQAPAAALLAASVDGLAKIRPPDLARWGVSSRDKLPQRADQPLRTLVDRIAALFAIEDYDVYQHAMPDRGAFVENTSRPAVLVPAWLAEQPLAQQTFVVTQALVNLARGVFTIDLFTPRELDILLAASARAQVPGFGERVATAEVLDEYQRTISRAVARKRRRAHEISAEAYAQLRGPDVSTFVHWVRQSARRIALVVADDLAAGITQVARAEQLGGKTGIAAVRSSPVIADLLRVWVSKPAMLLRYGCGLLPPQS